MEIRERCLIKLLAGFVIGAIISLVFCTLGVESDNLIHHISYLLMHMIVGGLFGTVALGGSIVYDFEDWGILKAMITHYLSTLTLFLVVNSVLDWFDKSTLCILVVVYTVLYIIIWMVKMMMYVRDIREINEMLTVIKRAAI